MKRLHQLDAVRGVAVLLVLLHNTDIYPSLHLGLIAANGWMGVDLFFVLSGFLITGILIDTKRSEHYFKNFYVRRCLRIWPLYYASLLLMFVIVPTLRPAEAHSVFGVRSSPWWAYPLFLQNFLVSSPTMATGLLGVTWSLAVEEQFYLVWPLVVRFCTGAQLRRVAFGVICVSPFLRLYLSMHHVNIYTNTFCRLDGLMGGALLALTIRSNGFVASSHLMKAWSALLVSLPLALAMEVLNARWIGFSLVALSALSFVYLALFSGRAWLQRLMASRSLIYTGTISYGIYLLAHVPLDIAKSFNAERHPFLAFSVTAIATYGLATLSWLFLEKPFLRLKRHFGRTAISRDRAAEGLVKVA